MQKSLVHDVRVEIIALYHRSVEVRFLYSNEIHCIPFIILLVRSADTIPTPCSGCLHVQQVPMLYPRTYCC